LKSIHIWKSYSTETKRSRFFGTQFINSLLTLTLLLLLIL